jgi:hypothetical protein
MWGSAVEARCAGVGRPALVVTLHAGLAKRRRSPPCQAPHTDLRVEFRALFSCSSHEISFRLFALRLKPHDQELGGTDRKCTERQHEESKWEPKALRWLSP